MSESTKHRVYTEWLVLRCQDGDARALAELADLWHPRFLGLAIRLTGDREAARDVVQDSWVAVVHGLRTVRDPSRFSSWALRIVANKSRDWIRRRRTKRQFETEQEAPMECEDTRRPGDELDRESEIEFLRLALRRLDSDDATILSLHHLDGMSIREVAEALQIPAGTVKSRLHAARARLRAALEERTQ